MSSENNETFIYETLLLNGYNW